MLLCNSNITFPDILTISQTGRYIVAGALISTPLNVGFLSMSTQRSESDWSKFLTHFRAGEDCTAFSWHALFGQIQAKPGMISVIGQLGQSLDGRIATVTGHSKYINGHDGLLHLHRLRALVDAVVVGAGTVVADNPKLTVRMVEGPHPARVLIDPNGRVPASSGLYQNDGVDRMVFTSKQNRQNYPEGVDVVLVEKDINGRVPPAIILGTLRDKGYRRVLIEGGADTVTKFMLAGCLDRVHVILAPMVIGAGRPSFDLPVIESLKDAIRMPMKMHPIGKEVVLDCDLSSLRLVASSVSR